MIDWKIAAIIAMLLLGVYNIILKQFFKVGEDWRALIPFVFAVVLVLAIYFATAYKDVRFTGSSAAYGIVIVAMICILALVTLIAFSHPESKVNVIVPILALSTVVTAVLSVIFLGEAVSLNLAAGIALALISLYLITTG